MTDGEALLAAVLRNPGDAIAPLVYADWLEERGDSRAEYLRLLAGLGEPDAPECGGGPRERLRELREALDPAWAGAIDRARLLPGGVYWHDDGSTRDFLRFYPDGTVDSVCSTGTPEQVWRWFDREHRKDFGHFHGEYTVRADRLSFFVADDRVGRIEYAGVVGGRALALALHSRINDFRGVRRYGFVELGPAAAGG